MRRPRVTGRTPVAAAAAALAAVCLVAARPDPPGLPAEAAPWLVEADRAFLAGDDTTAQAGFARVLARAPAFRPALWGRAVALLRLGRDYQAWPLLDTALGPDPTPEACRAAARVASAPGPGGTGLTATRLAAARRYLELAGRPGARGDGPDPEGVEAEVRLARHSGRDGEADRAWQALVARRPERYAFVERPGPRAAGPRAAGPPDTPAEPAAPAFGGDWERVRLALAAALALGAAWAAGLGLLFVAGDALSRVTLRLVDRDGRGLAIPRAHGPARWAYRAVIRATAVYFDVSLAVVTVLITAVPAALLYGLATSPRVSGGAVLAAVPLGLVPALLLAPLARSLRVRLVEQPAGRLLGGAEAPALWGLAREVARAVGTRPVDEIRLATGAQIGVLERGSPRDKRDGRSVRSLLLGMATFDGFLLPAFRAVLAHEYAHLLHRDTDRPAAAVHVAARLDRTRAWIALWRGDAWWNIGWHFVSSYGRIFRRVSRGADRFAEVHADRVAALAYGPGPAADGLLHTIRRHAEYEDAQARAVGEALHATPDDPRRLLRNARAVRCRSVAARVEAELHAAPHADHTHPTAARRLALFRALEREKTARPAGRDGAPADPAAADGDGDGLWSLFPDPDRARAEYRRRCDADVQARLEAHAAFAAQAVAPLTEAVLDDPGRPGPYLDRAEALLSLGDYPGAARDLDAAVERNPRDARARFARGQVRGLTGDPAGAAEDLREAMRLSRVAFEPAVRAALGDLAAAAGDLAGAVAEYGRSIDLDRSHPEIFLKRANARLRLGRASQAAADFARAAELDGESAEARVGLAAACEVGGEYHRALAAAEGAVAIDPALPDGHTLLARLLLRPSDGSRPDVPRGTAHARKAVALTRGTCPDAAAVLADALSLCDPPGPAPAPTARDAGTASGGTAPPEAPCGPGSWQGGSKQTDAGSDNHWTRKSG